MIKKQEYLEAKKIVDQYETEQLNIGGVMPRYFLDVRAGCGAVRDRKHKDYDEDYQGLHQDTCDVVLYIHGYRNEKTGLWEMGNADINKLQNRCDVLNGL